MKVLKIRWTLEMCKKEALKYNSRKEFSDGSTNAYYHSLRTGWLDQTCQHMKTIYVNRTFENCKEEALRYNSRSDFKKKNPNAYQAARSNKWLKDICKHMIILWEPKWTLEECKKSAAIYSGRHEFEKGNRKAYGSAVRHGWIDKCCSHMKLTTNVSSSEKELLNKIKEFHPDAQKLRDWGVKIPNKSYIKGFDIDIYIPELRKGIEFDGTYWHSLKGIRRGRPNWPQEDLENYHQIKDSYFKSKGIELLHVRQKDWIEDKESCIKKCLEFLNV
jgi:hypothetical protein